MGALRDDDATHTSRAAERGHLCSRSGAVANVEEFSVEPLCIAFGGTVVHRPPGFDFVRAHIPVTSPPLPQQAKSRQD